MTRTSRPRSSRSPAQKLDAWCWERRIDPATQDEWIDLLRKQGFASWTLAEKPGQVRALLTVYPGKASEAARLARELGGTSRLLRASEWLSTRPMPPIEIGPHLRIVHEPPGGRGEGNSTPQLYIPHGLAFGSGEHATTSMLLRAVSRLPDLSGSSVLDIGTGSGILALTARLRGASAIAGTDWDAEAIRTARQNEALNFSRKLIRWQRADVRRLGAKARYDLVLANLFSGILCEAAGVISAAVSPGGRLWLSGILRGQEGDVVAAYRAEKLRLVRSLHRGKWVMLQWRRPGKAR